MIWFSEANSCESIQSFFFLNLIYFETYEESRWCHGRKPQKLEDFNFNSISMTSVISKSPHLAEPVSLLIESKQLLSDQSRMVVMRTNWDCYVEGLPKGSRLVSLLYCAS